MQTKNQTETKTFSKAEVVLLMHGYSPFMIMNIEK